MVLAGIGETAELTWRAEGAEDRWRDLISALGSGRERSGGACGKAPTNDNEVVAVAVADAMLWFFGLVWTVWYHLLGLFFCILEYYSTLV